MVTEISLRFSRNALHGVSLFLTVIYAAISARRHDQDGATHLNGQDVCFFLHHHTMPTHHATHNAMQGDLVYDYAIVIGRFQPVHNGHVALLQAGLQQARRLIVVAGSMHQPRSFKNPFTVAEREQMIRAALPRQDQARVQVVGVSVAPYDDAVWLQAVQNAVHASMAAHGSDPVTARVALLGHMKDNSSYYLRIFPHWQWLPFPNVEGIDATSIRHQYFPEEKDAHLEGALSAVLPASTLDFLHTFRASPAWQALHAERAFLLDFWQRHRYANGSAMPVLCLVQVVVLWRQQVLLVQRQQQPGRGNWALPEALLQAGERLLDAASRALQAAGMEWPAATLKKHVSATAVWDAPGRNQLGHAISHALCVRWPDDAPDPAGADQKENQKEEAPHTQWQPLAQWRTMHPLLHEDHYFIARHFLDGSATPATPPFTPIAATPAPDENSA